jgi:hypothetical protein
MTLAVIQDEDRDGPMAAELLDLGAIPRKGEPGPRPQASALDPLDLVPVPGVVKRLRCAAARMGERGRWAAGDFSKEQVYTTRSLFGRPWHY